MCGEQLNVVPFGQFIPRHAHGIHDAVMACLAQPVAGVGVDFAGMRLFSGAMTGVSIEPQIRFAEIGLRVLMRPGVDFILINQNIIALDPSLEFGQLFRVVVRGHAAVEAVIPIMHTANEVLATHKAVRHQSAPVQTATIEHRHVVIDAHDDKIDLAHQRIGRVAVFEVTEFGNAA